MPDVAAGIALEGDDDSSHGLALTRAVSFQPISFGSGGVAGSVYRSVPVDHVLESVKAPAIENLKAHQVQVNGVHIVGEVHEFPDFRGIEHRFLGDGHMPRRLVQQHPHGFGYPLQLLVQCEPSSLDGGGLRDARHGPQRRGQRARVRDAALHLHETA